MEEVKRFLKALKKCKNSCVKEDIENHITSCGDESSNEEGALVGFDFLALDPYCQSWLDILIGNKIVWVNSDYKVVKIG